MFFRQYEKRIEIVKSTGCFKITWLARQKFGTRQVGDQSIPMYTWVVTNSATLKTWVDVQIYLDENLDARDLKEIYIHNRTDEEVNFGEIYAAGKRY